MMGELFQRKFLGKSFAQVGKLVGHEDWVTCLASKQEEETGGLLLATGSQDSFVRLWKVERKKEELEEKEVKEQLAVTEQVVKLGKEDWLVVVESVLAGFESCFADVVSI